MWSVHETWEVYKLNHMLIHDTEVAICIKRNKCKHIPRQCSIQELHPREVPSEPSGHGKCISGTYLPSTRSALHCFQGSLRLGWRRRRRLQRGWYLRITRRQKLSEGGRWVCQALVITELQDVHHVMLCLSICYGWCKCRPLSLINENKHPALVKTIAYLQKIIFKK